MNDKERKEFSRILEEVAKFAQQDSIPISPPSTGEPVFVDDSRIKNAIKNVSAGGVRLLQRTLMVDDDGIFGRNTQKALDDIDVDILLTKLNQATVPSSSLSFEALAPEYRLLFENSRILPSHKTEVHVIASAIMKNTERYAPISKVTNVPEHIIGILHSLECSLNFSRHLHNGDSLSRRTVNVPSGRPVGGSPPFTFEESAIDALAFYEIDQWPDASPERIAHFAEGWNGWGYRLYHPDVKSPFLWSFTDVYTKGKYDADGHYDPNLVSAQAGAMAILKELLQWT